MPLARRRVTDPEALKVLAHPLRMALLGALVTEGPMTASQAAVLLDDSPSNCSWHLRRLAEHGFVREARRGTGRNRPWQAVGEGLEWGDDVETAAGGTPDTATRIAADALTDMLLEREIQRVRAARAARDVEPRAWREATSVAQGQAWLTAEEAHALKDDMLALLTRHRERNGQPDLRPEGARLVSMVSWLVPSGPQQPAATGADVVPLEGAGDAEPGVPA